MFVLPHSLPPTEWLTLPLTLPPSLFSSKSVLCFHSLSKLLFWLEEVVVWLYRVEFFYFQILFAQWGGCWWELLSVLKSHGREGSRSVLLVGGWEKGHFAGVAHRLLWTSKLSVFRAPLLYSKPFFNLIQRLEWKTTWSTIQGFNSCSRSIPRLSMSISAPLF